MVFYNKRESDARICHAYHYHTWADVILQEVQALTDKPVLKAELVFAADIQVVEVLPKDLAVQSHEVCIPVCTENVRHIPYGCNAFGNSFYNNSLHRSTDARVLLCMSSNVPAIHSRRNACRDTPYIYAHNIHYSLHI